MPINIKVTGTPDSETRAEWAENTIKRHQKEHAYGLVKNDDDSMLECTTYLLADIFHFLDTITTNNCEEVDKWDLAQKAMDLYRNELKEEQVAREIRKRVPKHIADKVIIKTIGGKSND